MYCLLHKHKDTPIYIVINVAKKSKIKSSLFFKLIPLYTDYLGLIGKVEVVKK
jgi:hypothetical protein